MNFDRESRVAEVMAYSDCVVADHSCPAIVIVTTNVIEDAILSGDAVADYAVGRSTGAADAVVMPRRRTASELE